MDHRQSGKQRCCMNQPHQKGMLPDLAAGQAVVKVDDQTAPHQPHRHQKGGERRLQMKQQGSEQQDHALIDFTNETEDDLNFLLSEAEVVFRCFMDNDFLDQSIQNLSRQSFGTADLFDDADPVLCILDAFAEIFCFSRKNNLNFNNPLTSACYTADRKHLLEAHPCLHRHGTLFGRRS